MQQLKLVKNKKQNIYKVLAIVETQLVPELFINHKNRNTRI